MCARKRRQTLRNLLEQLVADEMAECVVECFEIIEIDEQQGAIGVIVMAGLHCPLQVFMHATAVGQAGQRVKVGQLVDFFEVLIALGHVAQGTGEQHTLIGLHAAQIDFGGTFAAILAPCAERQPVPHPSHFGHISNAGALRRVRGTKSIRHQAIN